jgi:hypothetical protein
MDLLVFNSDYLSIQDSIAKLSARLNVESWVFHAQGIETASVPIVKVEVDGSHLDVEYD